MDEVYGKDFHSNINMIKNGIGCLTIENNLCALFSGSRLVLASQYWIPRVRLMFAAEDPEVFAQRVTSAFKDRQETESFLR